MASLRKQGAWSHARSFPPLIECFIYAKVAIQSTPGVARPVVHATPPSCQGCTGPVVALIAQPLAGRYVLSRFGAARPQHMGTPQDLAAPMEEVEVCVQGQAGHVRSWKIMCTTPPNAKLLVDQSTVSHGPGTLHSLDGATILPSAYETVPWGVYKYVPRHHIGNFISPSFRHVLAEQS